VTADLQNYARHGSEPRAWGIKAHPMFINAEIGETFSDSDD
jgi:hypothetical protein